MTNGVLIIGDSIHLSREWLIDKGVSVNTIKKWIARKVVTVIGDNDNAYIPYTSIPPLTRKKLPTETELLAQLTVNNSPYAGKSLNLRNKYV